VSVYKAFQTTGQMYVRILLMVPVIKQLVTPWLYLSWRGSEDVSKKAKNDMVEHYRKGPSPRKFAMDWGLNPHLFNVIKYVARCNHKQYKNQDLHKAIWYLVVELTDDEELSDEIVDRVKKHSLS
jgi:hypothetical protein